MLQIGTVTLLITVQLIFLWSLFSAFFQISEAFSILPYIWKDLMFGSLFSFVWKKHHLKFQLSRHSLSYCSFPGFSGCNASVLFKRFFESGQMSYVESMGRSFGHSSSHCNIGDMEGEDHLKIMAYVAWILWDE